MLPLTRSDSGGNTVDLGTFERADESHRVGQNCATAPPPTRHVQPGDHRLRQPGKLQADLFSQMKLPVIGWWQWHRSTRKPNWISLKRLRPFALGPHLDERKYAAADTGTTDRPPTIDDAHRETDCGSSRRHIRQFPQA